MMKHREMTHLHTISRDLAQSHAISREGGGCRLRVPCLRGGAVVARRHLAVGLSPGAVVCVVSERQLRVHISLRDVVGDFVRDYNVF